MTRPDRRKDKFRQQHIWKSCEWCGERFEAYRPDHRFHCKACSNSWHAADRKLQSMPIPQALQPQVKKLVKEWLTQPGCEPVEISTIVECVDDDPNFIPSFIKTKD